MPRGGARKNAGRKKGGKNRLTKESIKAAEKYEIQPLDYLLSIVNNKRAKRAERIDASKAALPYLKPRLNATKMEIEANVFEETVKERSMRKMLEED